MNAQEAREIAKEHELKINEALENIKSHAGDGYRYIVFHRYSDELCMQLIGLGYSVSKMQDGVIEVLKVTW